MPLRNVLLKTLQFDNVLIFLAFTLRNSFFKVSPQSISVTYLAISNAFSVVRILFKVRLKCSSLSRTRCFLCSLNENYSFSCLALSWVILHLQVFMTEIIFNEIINILLLQKCAFHGCYSYIFFNTAWEYMQIRCQVWFRRLVVCNQVLQFTYFNIWLRNRKTKKQFQSPLLLLQNIDGSFYLWEERFSVFIQKWHWNLYL